MSSRIQKTIKSIRRSKRPMSEIETLSLFHRELYSEYGVSADKPRAEAIPLLLRFMLERHEPFMAETLNAHELPYMPALQMVYGLLKKHHSIIGNEGRPKEREKHIHGWALLKIEERHARAKKQAAANVLQRHPEFAPQRRRGSRSTLVESFLKQCQKIDQEMRRLDAEWRASHVLNFHAFKAEQKDEDQAAMDYLVNLREKIEYLGVEDRNVALRNWFGLWFDLFPESVVARALAILIRPSAHAIGNAQRILEDEARAEVPNQKPDGDLFKRNRTG